MTQEERERIIAFNGLYEEEISEFYSLPKEKQEEIIEETKKQIEQLETNEKKLAEELTPLFVAIAFCDSIEETLTESDINKLYEERISYIREARRFFEKPESEEIYQKYGIAETEYNGEYKTESILSVTFQDSGFNIDDEIESKRRFTEILEKVWQDRQVFPTEEVLKNDSIKENGIGFKEFLFCEEYIRTGKITETSKSLGIGRTTCYEYLKKKEVKEYLEKRRKEIKEESDNMLQQGFIDCFESLLSMIRKDNYIQDREKIRAIDTYLRYYSDTTNKK